MLNGRPACRWFVSAREIGAKITPVIDFQMHTVWTDGHDTVAEMISSAKGKQLNAIAITEHVNESSVWYPRFVAEVRTEREQHEDLEIYYGAEIAAADHQGRMKADPERLNAEIVLGVVHRYPKQDGSGVWNFADLTRDDAVELEISALKGLAANRQIDVLGHPGGTTFYKFGPFPVEWLEEAFRVARDHDIAVELNSKYIWDLPGMLALLQRLGTKVSFGSDAHRSADVGGDYAGCSNGSNSCDSRSPTTNE